MAASTRSTRVLGRRGFVARSGDAYARQRRRIGRADSPAGSRLGIWGGRKIASGRGLGQGGPDRRHVFGWDGRGSMLWAVRVQDTTKGAG